MTRVEICLETVQSLRAAKLGGADRVELCASLAVGGLTPSPGMMRFAAELGVPTRVLLRPRGGTFVYDVDEIAVIEQDIAAVKGFGLAGVVIGAATPDDRLDRDMLARLLDRCEGLGRTLHRVFDRTPDPFEALELAIELGFDRILTSGQAPLAMDGAGLLEQLVAAAAGRIVILPACGIDADNVGALVAATGVEEVHATCTDQVEGPPDAGKFGFGYPPASATPQAVETLVRNARNAARGGTPAAALADRA
jgi:copper homeostasis protein